MPPLTKKSSSAPIAITLERPTGQSEIKVGFGSWQNSDQAAGAHLPWTVISEATGRHTNNNLHRALIKEVVSNYSVAVFSTISVPYLYVSFFYLLFPSVRFEIFPGGWRMIRPTT